MAGDGRVARCSWCRELFAGHNSPAYGIVVTGLGDFVSGVSVDTGLHTAMIEIDFGGGTAGNDLIRLYIDHTNLPAPDATADIAATYLPDTFTQIRIGTKGTIQVDNLCISDTVPPCSALPVELGSFTIK